MATEVKAYRANDGMIFATECLAATRDVELLVTDSPLAENAPFARKLVEWLTSDDSAKIIEALQAHARACPKEEVVGTLYGEPVKSGTLEHRKSAAIGQMQRLGVPAKRWLTEHGFTDMKHFVDQATEAEVESWEHFSEEPAAFRQSDEKTKGDTA